MHYEGSKEWENVSQCPGQVQGIMQEDGWMQILIQWLLNKEEEKLFSQNLPCTIHSNIPKL